MAMQQSRTHKFSNTRLVCQRSSLRIFFHCFFSSYLCFGKRSELPLCQWTGQDLWTLRAEGRHQNGALGYFRGVRDSKDLGWSDTCFRMRHIEIVCLWVKQCPLLWGTWMRRDVIPLFILLRYPLDLIDLVGWLLKLQKLCQTNEGHWGWYPPISTHIPHISTTSTGWYVFKHRRPDLGPSFELG